MSISAKLHVWKSDLFQAVGPVDLVDGVVQFQCQKAFGAVLPRMLDPIADCVELFRKRWVCRSRAVLVAAWRGALQSIWRKAESSAATGVAVKRFQSQALNQIISFARAATRFGAPASEGSGSFRHSEREECRLLK